jgi:4'-phosphopantetheinyl transferase EntD
MAGVLAEAVAGVAVHGLGLALARAVLPGAVTVGAAAIGAAGAAPAEAWPSEAWPEEIAALPRAVPRRRAEFAAGRAAARMALAGLGLPPVALPPLPDRLPRWPPGIRGSIAHCATVAVACATRAALSPGIDIEPDAPLPPDLAEAVAAPRELAGDLPAHAARIVFAAKEAVFKAQFPLTRTWLDFADLVVTLGRDGRFVARLDRAAHGGGACPEAVAGRWIAAGGLIVTGAVVPLPALVPAPAPGPGGDRPLARRAGRA